MLEYHGDVKVLKEFSSDHALLFQEFNKDKTRDGAVIYIQSFIKLFDLFSLDVVRLCSSEENLKFILDSYVHVVDLLNKFEDQFETSVIGYFSTQINDPLARRLSSVVIPELRSLKYSMYFEFLKIDCQLSMLLKKKAENKDISHLVEFTGAKLSKNDCSELFYQYGLLSRDNAFDALLYFAISFLCGHSKASEELLLYCLYFNLKLLSKFDFNNESIISDLYNCTNIEEYSVLLEKHKYDLISFGYYQIACRGLYFQQARKLFSMVGLPERAVEEEFSVSNLERFEKVEIDGTLHDFMIIEFVDEILTLKSKNCFFNFNEFDYAMEELSTIASQDLLLIIKGFSSNTVFEFCI